MCGSQPVWQAAVTPSRCTGSEHRDLALTGWLPGWSRISSASIISSCLRHRARRHFTSTQLAAPPACTSLWPLHQLQSMEQGMAVGRVCWQWLLCLWCRCFTAGDLCFSVREGERECLYVHLCVNTKVSNVYNGFPSSVEACWIKNNYINILINNVMSCDDVPHEDDMTVLEEM